MEYNVAIGATLRKIFSYNLIGLTDAEMFRIVFMKWIGKESWFEMVLLLFHLRTRWNGNSSGQFAFVQFSEMTFSLRAGDKTVNAVLLRRATDDECNHTLDAGGMPTITSGLGKLSGAISFTLIVFVHHVVRWTNFVALFTPPLSWLSQRVCVNWFYRTRLVSGTKLNYRVWINKWKHNVGLACETAKP